MGYTLSRKAEEDIIAIFLHGVEQFGIKQAECYHDLLESTFGFLAEHPAAARERPEISPPVRVHPIKSHLIFYTIDEYEDIFIIRIRHSREDWQDE